MWKTLVLASVLALAATVASAAPARSQLLVTPDWLAQHLSDPDLVVLDAGSHEQYSRGHIPGARLVKDVLSVNAGILTHEVSPPDELREKMEALGISDNSHIVVYNDTDELQRGTRVMFTLEVAGFGNRSALLDGGLAEWKSTGHAVSHDAVPIPRGHLSPLKIAPLVVDADFVRAHSKAPGYDLIDGRDAILYGGLFAKLNGDGHIPGAESLPYTSVFDSGGTLKSADALKELFARAGYKPGDHVIAYCHSGFKVTTVIFAGLTIGIHAKLYDGSIEDWKNRHLPLITSSSPE
jgi:thiosulfate/3-mercaptopyruvate sulfurtransferase